MSRKEVIVCVDDEEGVLRVLRAQLGARFGHEAQVLTARSGDEAVALFDELSRDGESIALVIADQIMPGMKGVELLEIVNRRMPGTMKILLTGQAGLDAVIEGLAKDLFKLSGFVPGTVLGPGEFIDLTITFAAPSVPGHFDDAVLVITPNYYRSAITQETLAGFYTDVADASPVPVMLYSMPALTGIKLEPATIARLSEHPNIAGMKDSCNDVASFAETVRLCPDNFAVMTGNGTGNITNPPPDLVASEVTTMGNSNLTQDW